MELAYKKLGEGTPIVILHGLYGMSDNWISIGRELAQNYEVYLLDLRNHGDSPHADTISYPEMARDIFVFFNHLSLEKAIILGHSMGGKTAAFFAALYPEFVEKLIIVDILPFSNNKPEDLKHARIHRGIIDALKSIDLNKVKTRTEISKELEKKIGSKPVAQFLMKNINRDSDNNFSWKLNLKVISEQLEQIFKVLKKEIISDIETFENIPSLFIKGGNSDYLLDNDFEVIKSYMPLAQFKTIENAGHWVHAEEPEEFLEIVNSFLMQVK